MTIFTTTLLKFFYLSFQCFLLYQLECVNNLHNHNINIPYKVNARNKDQKLVSCFSKMKYFYRLLHCCPIEDVYKIQPIKIDIDQLNAKLG